MDLTVLGGSGAYPTAEQGCGGYLIRHDGFTLLLDPGYATFTPLLAHVSAAEVDAVWISHGHPDHCADLSPLLRTRSFSSLPPLPVYAPPGAVEAVLALHPPTAPWAQVHEVRPGRFALGPFEALAVELPHYVPNLGLRLDAAFAYTGDSGPDPAVAVLADDVETLLAEATSVERQHPLLSTAAQAAHAATQASVGHLILTHLLPTTDRTAALTSARTHFTGPVTLATPPDA